MNFLMVNKKHKANKNFTYEKNKLTLNFNLDIENKKELETFKELLEEAIKDVDEHILKI